MKMLSYVLLIIFVVFNVSLSHSFELYSYAEYREVNLMGRVVKLHFADCQKGLFVSRNNGFWRCRINLDTPVVDYSELIFLNNYFEEKHRCGEGKNCIVSTYIYPSLATISIRYHDWWKTQSYEQLLNRDDAVAGLQSYFAR